MSRRRIRFAVMAVAASLATAAGATSTNADQTGLSGQVESTIELSIESAAHGALELTVTATASDTALAISTDKRERILDTYAGPVTNARTMAPAGSGDQTITFGPVGP